MKRAPTVVDLEAPVATKPRASAKRDEMASGTRHEGQYIDGVTDEITWFLPGVHRTIEFKTYRMLFSDHDLVCRANRDCVLESSIGNPSETLRYKSGDVIAATNAASEESLYKALQERGINEDAVIIEPGARWSRHSRGPRGR